MRQPRVAPQARRDLDELHHYGTLRYGAGQADAYLAELFEVFERIAQTPFAFVERKQVRPPIRMRVHRAHNIFYDVTEVEVIISRVIYHSGDWMHEL